jgi:hypothetical protein
VADLLAEGVAAFKAGDKLAARNRFVQAVKEQPDSERAWGWLYNVANNDQERVHCLQQVLRINPQNEKARQSIDELTGLVPPLDVPRSAEIPGFQPVRGQSYAATTPAQKEWYRSNWFYLLTFLLVTPLWSVLIITDKNQKDLYRAIAGLVLVVYVIYCCAVLMTTQTGFREI